MQLLIFLLSCYGATNIITGGKIFAGFRRMAAKLPGKAGKWACGFVHCPMCVGFWVGVAAKACFHFGINVNTNIYGEMFLFGLMSSGFCWIVRVVLHHLGEDDL